MDRSRQSRGDHHALLGHAPRDPFAGCGGAPRKPAVDFSDVFGGAPKRFSGLGDATGAGGLGGGGEGGGGGVEEDGERSRRWSSSVVEKAVFAGVGSPAHRRHLGDGFFSDIFRGDESACPTPRRKDRDLVTPSTPGSKVLSPNGPLPPSSVPFGGGAHLPGHLSYSTRLAKSFDYSSFRYSTASAAHKHEESIPDDVISFPSSPNVCAPASPNRFFRIKDILRFDTHASCRQSPLSHVVPHDVGPLETITSVGDSADETEKQLKKDPMGSKAYSSSGRFHFSIYKWASRGVTLIMPSNFKERTKSGSRLSGLSSQVLQQADQPLDNENMLQGTQALKNQSEIEDKRLFNDLASAESDNMGSSKEATEPLPAAADIKSVPCGITDTSDDTGTCIEDNRGLSEEEGKLEAKNPHPINDNPKREGNEGITREVTRKSSLVNDCKTAMKDGDDTAEVKQENRRHMILGFTEDASMSSSILEDKILSGGANRKVMDFVKIFNQEAVQKNCGTVESRARRPKAKYKVKGRVENHASARIAAADLDDNGNYDAASSTPVAAGQSLKKELQKTSVEGLGVEKVDGFLPEINGTSASLSDSLDASFCNTEEAHFVNIEECLVEELSQDNNEVTETGFHQEKIEIKMSDTRIQEWSKGKEGNIRSLLSTLQYVLWPGSGWKPVPLVDIIEGTSVRRAYQKALLCLHPDKLQQKGAKTNQKYIAEKVFDMLQEAWNRFNSLGPL